MKLAGRLEDDPVPSPAEYIGWYATKSERVCCTPVFLCFKEAR